MKPRDLLTDFPGYPRSLMCYIEMSQERGHKVLGAGVFNCWPWGVFEGIRAGSPAFEMDLSKVKTGGGSVAMTKNLSQGGNSEARGEMRKWVN